MKNQIKQTEHFEKWLDDLKDHQARLKIVARIDAAKVGNFGNFGDCRPVGQGLSEMRINYGPGYRVYYGQISLFVFLLVAGGVKASQDRDIAKAKTLWKVVKEAAYDA